MPSYNRAHLLSIAIESVLLQHYSNWELLIVDDGSTDNTQKVIQDYNDIRIVYFKKNNGGVCSARNYGVQHAKGEYIAFLDSDDSVTKEWLFNFYNCITNLSLPDIICGGLERVD